jgi:hypothetical protein
MVKIFFKWALHQPVQANKVFVTMFPMEECCRPIPYTGDGWPRELSPWWRCALQSYPQGGGIPCRAIPMVDLSLRELSIPMVDLSLRELSQHSHTGE